MCRTRFGGEKSKAELSQVSCHEAVPPAGNVSSQGVLIHLEEFENLSVP